ncbi:membrane protein insertion efficiency factor YidD [Aliisedimentitalea sp. MJ-SS2]|uniref:membrane protein insertion efficiency factor YidD n=1 Tax=Aliisedimentitalea sp. MJ-SS2 TaxID=3049795 RepID=UPI0034606EE9
MRAFLIGIVLLYQKLAPSSIRERCLFHTSCSNYVLDGLRQKGIKSATKRFFRRIRQCRPGYYPIEIEMNDSSQERFLNLADGSTIPEKDISSRVLCELGWESRVET